MLQQPPPNIVQLNLAAFNRRHDNGCEVGNKHTLERWRIDTVEVWLFQSEYKR